MAVNILSTKSPTPPADADASPLKVVDLPVASLKPYPNNPRKNDAAVPKMVGLIARFGWRQPILVRGTEIVDGHLRVKAALKMKRLTVPAINVGALSEVEVRALRLAMNKSAEFAEWDEPLLAGELKFISESDFPPLATGFDEAEFNKLVNSLLDPGPPKNQSANAGDPADPSNVSLTFHMTATERELVRDALEAMRIAKGYKTRSQALVALCKEA